MESILGEHKRIMIKQKKEWGEILLGFEARNRYALLDESGQELGFAAEQGGGIARTIGRLFLGAARKCTLHLFDDTGEKVGRGDKPFRWFFYEMSCYDGDEYVGCVKRRWRIFGRRFTIYDASDTEVLTIDSPFLKIWTFKILSGAKEVGRITKKWSGALKEMFTDADTFGVEFRSDMHPDAKKLLLIATFLIDFTCFENNQKR